MEWCHFFVEKRTLKRYFENSARFSGEQCTLLGRSVHTSPKNSAHFSREHWSLLRRTLESSQENVRVFSGERSSLLERTFESSRENIEGLIFLNTNSQKNYFRRSISKPSKVLQRTFQGSQTNIGGSKNRHRNIILCRVKLIDNYNRYLIWR